jgi:putative transposase
VGRRRRGGGGCLGPAGPRRDAREGALGGDLVGPNPTDRGKRGTKKSLLVDARGGPLAAVLAAANVNDHRLTAATLDAIVPVRPTTGGPTELYADRGYDHPECDAAAADRGYAPRIARRGGGWVRADAPDPPRPPQYRRTRWIVERTLAWLSKCRALLVRYEKKAVNPPRLPQGRLHPPLVPPGKEASGIVC